MNPSNIMMNAGEVPVRIDFDACRAEGSKVSKGGTLGWSNENSTSLKENDYFGLAKIQEALEKHDRVSEGKTAGSKVRGPGERSFPKVKA